MINGKNVKCERNDQGPNRFGAKRPDSPRHGLYANGVLSIGQRHINITRIAIGPKSGQKDCRKFNLKGLHRLDINDYLFTFFFYLV